MNNKPKLSVVTVSYNCRDVMEQTICNVLKQTYGNIEYIIIDGGSTDGTKEIIERYRDRLAYYVSEPDRGIYDAMNKGIRAATGDWIIFRNAGDYFFKPTTVEEVFSTYDDQGEAVIAGGTRCFGQSGYRDKHYDGRGADVWQRAYISHPSAFVRMTVQKTHLFPTEYRIASDYYFFQQLVLEGAKIAIYDGLVSLFDCENGVSSQQNLGKKEVAEIRERLGAPKAVVRKSMRIYWKARVLGVFLDIIRQCPKLYYSYKRHHAPDNWVAQPMQLTLRDI